MSWTTVRGEGGNGLSATIPWSLPPSGQTMARQPTAQASVDQPVRESMSAIPQERVPASSKANVAEDTLCLTEYFRPLHCLWSEGTGAINLAFTALRPRWVERG